MYLPDILKVFKYDNEKCKISMKVKLPKDTLNGLYKSR